MLTLHSHPLSSCCWKVLIALREKDVAFETAMVNLGDADARAAFAALWPTAKIPLLVDDGRVVPETSIIIEHVDRHHPGRQRLIPEDAQAALEVRLWDRLFDLYVMTPMQRYIAQLLRPEAERDPRALAQSVDELGMAYAMIDERLPGETWAVGDGFSLADCAAAPALFYAAVVRPFAPGQTRLAGYFERLMARPSVETTIIEARPWFAFYPLRDALPARFLGEGAAQPSSM